MFSGCQPISLQYSLDMSKSLRKKSITVDLKSSEWDPFATTSLILVPSCLSHSPIRFAKIGMIRSSMLLSIESFGSTSLLALARTTDSKASGRVMMLTSSSPKKSLRSYQLAPVSASVSMLLWISSTKSLRNSSQQLWVILTLEKTLERASSQTLCAKLQAAKLVCRVSCSSATISSLMAILRVTSEMGTSLVNLLSTLMSRYLTAPLAFSSSMKFLVSVMAFTMSSTVRKTHLPLTMSEMLKVTSDRSASCSLRHLWQVSSSPSSTSPTESLASLGMSLPLKSIFSWILVMAFGLGLLGLYLRPALQLRQWFRQAPLMRSSKGSLFLLATSAFSTMILSSSAFLSEEPSFCGWWANLSFISSRFSCGSMYFLSPASPSPGGYLLVILLSASSMSRSRSSTLAPWPSRLQMDLTKQRKSRQTPLSQNSQAFREISAIFMTSTSLRSYLKATMSSSNSQKQSARNFLICSDSFSMPLKVKLTLLPRFSISSPMASSCTISSTSFSLYFWWLQFFVALTPKLFFSDALPPLFFRELLTLQKILDRLAGRVSLPFGFCCSNSRLTWSKNSFSSSMPLFTSGPNSCSTLLFSSGVSPRSTSITASRILLVMLMSESPVQQRFWRRPLRYSTTLNSAAIFRILASASSSSGGAGGLLLVGIEGTLAGRVRFLGALVMGAPRISSSEKQLPIPSKVSIKLYKREEPPDLSKNQESHLPPPGV